MLPEEVASIARTHPISTMGSISRECGTLPTPMRRRSSKGAEKPAVAPGVAAGGKAGAWRAEGIPPEAKGLSWPHTFSSKTKGERLQLSEDGALATRTSGVGYGVVFLGPLSLEHSGAYFEVEVAEMEPKRSQTMAIGVCSSLPTSESLRVERARDIGEGMFLLGYDLPKVYANGAEVSKISTKEWRPLKQLAVGDRVGLLIQRRTMELTVFVNGEKKVSVAGLGGPSQPRWPSELYGVVDLHGNVKAAWLRGPAAAKRQLQRNATVQMLPPEAPVAQPPDQELEATQQMGPSEVTSARPPPSRAGPAAAAAGGREATPGNRRAAAKAGLQATGGPKKRMRVLNHPCGCMVHLTRHTGDVVHVPREGDFVIGRNEKNSNLVVDSRAVPNMVSRRHAVLRGIDDAVVLEDCSSVNGTYLNDRRVNRETLRHGDVVIIGNPTHSPVDFEFRVVMP